MNKIVKIISYDPVKGKGWFQNRDGTQSFRYYKLVDQKMISPGKLAILRDDDFLFEAHTFKNKLRWWFKWR